VKTKPYWNDVICILVLNSYIDCISDFTLTTVAYIHIVNQQNKNKIKSRHL